MNNNKGDNVSYYMKENTRAILFHPYTWLVAIDGKSEPRIISPECTEEEAKVMVAALNARFYQKETTTLYLEELNVLLELVLQRIRTNGTFLHPLTNKLEQMLAAASPMPKETP